MRSHVSFRLLRLGGAKVRPMKSGTVTSSRNIPAGLTHIFTEAFYKEQLLTLAKLGVHCVMADYIGDFLLKVIRSMSPFVWRRRIRELWSGSKLALGSRNTSIIDIFRNIPNCSVSRPSTIDVGLRQR